MTTDQRDAAWFARSAGGRLVSGDPAFVPPGPVAVDTRLLRPGDVFLALPGEHTDGGKFVSEALRRGAAGVIAEPQHLLGLETGMAVAVADPRGALQLLAAAWRARLELTYAIGVTGAAGKTTTKDILAALLRRSGLAVHATRGGFNTLAGMAATVAGAPTATEALVVELAMRRRGHIASGARALQPTAGVITNVGPEHLEMAGSVEAVARNKAELIEALPPGAPCVVPAREPLLEPHLRADLRTVTHGPDGHVRLVRFSGGVAEIQIADSTVCLELGYRQPHRLANTVAAVAMAWAAGARVEDGPLEVEFSSLRWQRETLGDVELVLDCAKTSPLALRAALEDFAAEPAHRRIAVLSVLPDQGAGTHAFQREAGAHASRLGFEVLVAVGEQAESYLEGFAGTGYAVADPAQARKLLLDVGRPGDRALVKGGSAAALERIMLA